MSHRLTADVGGCSCKSQDRHQEFENERTLQGGNCDRGRRSERLNKRSFQRETMMTDRCDRRLSAAAPLRTPGQGSEREGALALDRGETERTTDTGGERERERIQSRPVMGLKTVTGPKRRSSHFTWPSVTVRSVTGSMRRGRQVFIHI